MATREAVNWSRGDEPPRLEAVTGGLASPESTADPLLGLFDDRELQLLALLADGQPAIKATKVMKLTAQAFTQHRLALFAKLGLPPKDSEKGRAAYLGLAHGLVPFTRSDVEPGQRLTASELTILRMAGQGHSVEATAKEVGEKTATVKFWRAEAGFKLTGNRKRVLSYPKLTFENGVLQPKDLAERLTFADQVRANTAEQQVLLINTKPPTLEDLTIGFGETEVREGRTYVVRKLMGTREFRARQMENVRPPGEIAHGVSELFDEPDWPEDEIISLNG